jgi:hypothetical protein
VATSEKIEGGWGIDPVPEPLRVLGALDTGLPVPSFLVAFAIALLATAAARSWSARRATA